MKNREFECDECEHKTTMIMLLAMVAAVFALAACLATVKYMDVKRALPAARRIQ